MASSAPNAREHRAESRRQLANNTKKPVTALCSFELLVRERVTTSLNTLPSPAPVRTPFEPQTPKSRPQNHLLSGSSTHSHTHFFAFSTSFFTKSTSSFFSSLMSNAEAIIMRITPVPGVLISRLSTAMLDASLPGTCNPYSPSALTSVFPVERIESKSQIRICNKSKKDTMRQRAGIVASPCKRLAIACLQMSSTSRRRSAVALLAPRMSSRLHTNTHAHTVFMNWTYK